MNWNNQKQQGGKVFSSSFKGNVFRVHIESENNFQLSFKPIHWAERRDQKWNEILIYIESNLKKIDRENKISDVFYSKVLKRNKTEKANNLIKCTVQKCLFGV